MRLFFRCLLPALALATVFALLCAGAAGALLGGAEGGYTPARAAVVDDEGSTLSRMLVQGVARADHVARLLEITPLGREEAMEALAAGELAAVIVLPEGFVDDIRTPNRDNAIDIYISEEHDDVLAEGVWQTVFKVKPEVLTMEEKKAWIAQLDGVTVGSDAFFPFGDNVERAAKSGVKYIVQPGGSIRDDLVIETANKHNMVMAFTGIRLFHH